LPDACHWPTPMILCFPCSFFVPRPRSARCFSPLFSITDPLRCGLSLDVNDITVPSTNNLYRHSHVVCPLHVSATTRLLTLWSVGKRSDTVFSPCCPQLLTDFPSPLSLQPPLLCDTQRPTGLRLVQKPRTATLMYSLRKCPRAHEDFFGAPMTSAVRTISSSSMLPLTHLTVN